MTKHIVFSALSSSLILALAACSPSTEAGETAGNKTTGGSGKVDPPPRPDVDPPPTADAPVPFQLELKGAAVEGFPGLHSGAGALHDGSLVLMAGRRNGLHAFPPERKASQIQAFPRTEANETIYVIDPSTKTLRGSAGIDKLPAAIQSQLHATNVQYEYQDGWLYIVGGYTY
ncbi:MAG TPA: hypothetical protein VK034_01455, partial [Enhygromyxa sp.]|nr:hypothetical protein [Enhygromyxa sp.]